MHPDTRALADDEHRIEEQSPCISVGLIYAGAAVAVWLLIGSALAIGWHIAGNLVEAQ